ncbi:MAG: 3-dehydroquinate dehydratase [bacterium]|nr:MAG: 3-dehydroquinate dehydratase [bacterium]
MKVLIINGPNINLLGRREKTIYGDLSYEELSENLYAAAKEKDQEIEIFQSNHEGEIVDRIQSSSGEFGFMIINPGAYTHTSLAIRDALLSVGTPFIEVHISNIYGREEFRKHSYISDIADGVISGFGTDVYFLALEGVQSILSSQKK